MLHNLLKCALVYAERGMEKIKFSTMSTLICIFAAGKNDIISLLAICAQDFSYALVVFSESFAIVLLRQRLRHFM